MPSLYKAAPWEDRYKSVESLPGGFLGYLDTLKRVCVIVDRYRPSKDGLISLLQSEFNQKSSHDSHLKANFLLRTNLLEEEVGICVVGGWTRQWLDDDNPGIVIALIHRRIRFVGEMLAEVEGTPRSAAELLSIANEKYGFAWKTPTQIAIRRGWLQAAGFIEIDDKKIAITEAGRAFLRGGLSLVTAPPEPVPVPEPMPTPSTVEETPFFHTPTRSDELAAALEKSSTESGDPSRFEQAVRDAFAFLGFRTELRGGSGKTDVLLTAPLGRSDSYKVAVDAKTTGSGRLTDGQVDWDTLVEHRQKERADYSLLVGPDPSGARLYSRAVNHRVTVLSARQLAEQCVRHERAPLGLEDYRDLFTTHGEADLTWIEDQAAESQRLRGIAADICQELATSPGTVGHLTARDLWLLMLRHKSPRVQAATEDEIQSVLDTLASLLVGAIQGHPDRGYVLATNAEVVQLRLTLLGKELVGSGPT